MVFKIRVIKYAQTHSNTRAASNFQIDRKTVREWLKKKDEIFSTARKRNRCKRPRKCKWPRMEEELNAWILNLRLQNRCVTDPMVKNHAMQIVENIEFRASSGRLANFLDRHNLVRRRVTIFGRE